jgi:hypothetical protein
MIYGHICYNSKKEANEQLCEQPPKVVCTECGEVTELHIGDYGFGDAFGGVSNYQVETVCCGSTHWEKGCSSCGEVTPLTMVNEIVCGRALTFWYCKECLEEMKKEKGENNA